MRGSIRASNLQRYRELEVQRFATPRSAPLVAGNDGMSLVTDTNGTPQLSITASGLVAAGGLTTVGDPGVWWAGYTRKCGRCAYFKINPGATNKQLWVGWDTNQSSTTDSGVEFVGTATANMPEAGVAVPVAFAYTAVAYEIATVLRPTGALTLMKGGTLTDWTLMWVGATLTTATMFPAIANRDAPFACTLYKVADLGGRWMTDYAMSSGTLLGSIAAGTTFTHTDDALIEGVMTTRPSAGSIQQKFRILDANNYGMVEVDSSGNLTLWEVIAGVSNSRATGTSVVSTNRISVRMKGATVQVFANQVSKGTGTFTTLLTGTSGSLSSLGTGGAWTRLSPWPLYPLVPAALST